MLVNPDCALGWSSGLNFSGAPQFYRQSLFIHPARLATIFLKNQSSCPPPPNITSSLSNLEYSLSFSPNVQKGSKGSEYQRQTPIHSFIVQLSASCRTFDAPSDCDRERVLQQPAISNPLHQRSLWVKKRFASQERSQDLQIPLFYQQSIQQPRSQLRRRVVYMRRSM